MMRHLYKEYPKEFYRLWWEYLRRSERYKDFCLKFGTPEQISDPDLDYTFTDNGDVHRPPFNDFEQWYQFKMAEKKANFETVSYEWCSPFDKPPIKKAKEIQKKDVQINYLDDIMRERFQEAVSHLSEELKREPTISEFQDYFFNDWRMMDLSEFVVTPGLFDSGKEVAWSVEKWLKGRTLRKPTTGYKVLEKYFKIYDIKQAGLNVKESISEAVKVGVFEFEPDDDLPSYDPDLDIDFDNKERSFNRDYIKALRIIKNTESNHFPGEY